MTEAKSPSPPGRQSPWANQRRFDVKIDGVPQCPGCGALVDGATALDLSGSAPKADDLTVCIDCAMVLEYVPDPLRPASLALALVTGDELTLALAHPDMRRLRQAVLQLIDLKEVDLDWLLERAGEYAAATLIGKTGPLIPMFMLQHKPPGRRMAAMVAHTIDNDHKAAFYAAVRHRMREGIVAYSFVSEAWVARQTPPPGWNPGQPPPPVDIMPVDHPERVEVVLAVACTATKHRFQSWDIVRGKRGRVRELVRRDMTGLTDVDGPITRMLRD